MRRQLLLICAIMGQWWCTACIAWYVWWQVKRMPGTTHRPAREPFEIRIQAAKDVLLIMGVAGLVMAYFRWKELHPAWRVTLVVGSLVDMFLSLC